MYRRPIFSLFDQKRDQRIASSGDPVNPIYDDGSEEETPEGEDPVVKYPSGTPNALNFGKLLASGEAGYFDIYKQSYNVERKDENDEIIKPKGQGIDWVYPSPPDLKGDKKDRDIYWGLPSGSTKGFFQSGIYIPPNDEHPESFGGSGLDFYSRVIKETLNEVTTEMSSEGVVGDESDESDPLRSNIYTIGVFNPNNEGSNFSNAVSSEFRQFFMKISESTYVPMCTDGVHMRTTFKKKTIQLQNYEGGTTYKDKQTVTKDYKYATARLRPDEQFGQSSSQQGVGLSVEEAIIDSLRLHLQNQESIEDEGETFRQRRVWYSPGRYGDGGQLPDNETFDIFTKYENITSSGVIGKIEVATIDDATDLVSVTTNVDICRVEQTYQGFGTQEFIMNHKGTGTKDEDSDEIVGLGPIIIPYLGDYTVIKQEEQEQETDGETTYDAKGCDAVKSRLEKILEGDEDLLKPEEETTSEETTDGTTGDGTTGDGTTTDNPE